MRETKTTNGTEEKLTIEEAFARIDDLIAEMEDEDVSLEDAFVKFKTGMDLVKHCEGEIDRIEKDVLQLTEDGETEHFDD